VTGVPSYREFLRAVPIVDWGRLAFELDPERAALTGPVTWAARLWGVAYAFRLRVPTITPNRWDRGFGRWVLPTRWHRAMYAMLCDRAQVRPVDWQEPTGQPIPLGPNVLDFTARQRLKLRRAVKAQRRAMRDRGEA
jgi:hypothetical protein